MTDKELIKEEIERRIKNLEFSLKNNCVEKYSKLDILGNITTLESLLQFIDSLPEEPKSEDLEEEMIRWHKEHFDNKRDWGKTSGEYLERKSQLDIAHHFAEWQKQKDLEGLFKSDMTMPNKFYEKGKADAMKEMKETLQTEYEKGRYDMREELMKNTVLETEVLMDCDGDGIETPYEEWITLEDTEIPYVPDGFKEGDIVKVVLIKEDLP